MGAVRFNLPGQDIEYVAPDFTVVPLPFPFFGWNQAIVSSHGQVSFRIGMGPNPYDSVWRKTEDWDPIYPTDDCLAVYWSETWNLYAPYAYSNNGPLYHVDPLGLCRVSYGTVTVDGSLGFHVTWNKMTGYKPDPEAGWDQRGTFQVIIYADNRFEFNYDQVQYTDYVDGARTIAGFDLPAPWLGLPGGRDLRYDFPGSPTSNATTAAGLVDGGPYALTASSKDSGVLGRYCFHYPDPGAGRLFPLRQVQRNDGLGRSALRARGGTSVQRSIRQRGYR